MADHDLHPNEYRKKEEQGKSMDGLREEFLKK